MTCEYPNLTSIRSYTNGCRCDLCLEKNRLRSERYRRKRGIKPPSSRVDSNGHILPENYIITPSGCWVWSHRPNANGYGRIRAQGKDWLAHRYMFWVCHNYLPVVVRHKCDNPPCVNPQHLEGGTQADNVRDMWSRGRAVTAKGFKGEDHPGSKVSQRGVEEIRSRWLNGESQKSIGRDFNIGSSQISNICRGAQWA